MIVWLNRIGGIGLALFALFSLLKTAPAHIGIALALPAAFVGAWHLRRAPWSNATRITVAVAAWLCLRFALQRWGGMVEHGLYDQQAVFIDWLFVPVFALLAAIPTDDPITRLHRLWLLAGAGFVMGVATFLWSQGFFSLWSGKRLAFHLDRALGVGLYAGCLAIALIATASLWWRRSAPLCWPRRLLTISMIGLLLQVVISTQNRSNILGFAIVIVCAVVYGLLHTLRHHDAGARRRLVTAGAVVLVLAVATISMNFGAISARFVLERAAMTSVINNGLDTAPAASVTVRLRLWQYVLERFPDAPIIGHGFGDLRDVIDRDLRPRGGLIPSERYDHVHNSYFQTLWTQGLLGVVFWAALSIILVADAMRAARHNRRVRALLPAMWGILIYTGVWAAFDYRLSHPDMRFFTLLLLLSLRLMGQAGSPPSRNFR